MWFIERKGVYYATKNNNDTKSIEIKTIYYSFTKEMVI